MDDPNLNQQVESSSHFFFHWKARLDVVRVGRDAWWIDIGGGWKVCIMGGHSEVLGVRMVGCLPLLLAPPPSLPTATATSSPLPYSRYSTMASV